MPPSTVKQVVLLLQVALLQLVTLWLLTLEPPEQRKKVALLLSFLLILWAKSFGYCEIFSTFASRLTNRTKR